MVATTEVLNAGSSISEIGWVFIRKELDADHKWETNLPFSSAFVLPPLTANMLHKNAGSNFAGNVLSLQNTIRSPTRFVFFCQICSQDVSLLKIGESSLLPVFPEKGHSPNFCITCGFERGKQGGQIREDGNNSGNPDQIVKRWSESEDDDDCDEGGNSFTGE